MNDHIPLNPDALEASERWMQEKSATFGLHWKNAKPIIEAYLAVAQPVVNSVEELDAQHAQSPLDPDALEAAKDSFDHAMGLDTNDRYQPWEEVAPSKYRDVGVEPAVSTYLNASQQVVTSVEELDRWLATVLAETKAEAFEEMAEEPELMLGRTAYVSTDRLLERAGQLRKMVSDGLS